MNSRKLSAAVLCAALASLTLCAVALGQNDAATDIAMTGNREGSLPLSCPSRWTASADFIILERVGNVHQPLVSTYPPHSPLILGSGTERLNSNDFNQGFAAGPRLGLIRHGECGCDWEFSFFQIDGWSSTRSIAPDGGMLPNWLVFTAPGDFVQTTDYPDQSMTWAYASRLYNAELNLRWDLCARLTMLAGFRWVSLWEDLTGTLPPERAVPFWDTDTRNNLYGFQIGADGKLFQRGRFSIDGLVKAGIFDNNAQESTGVSIYRTVYWESASTNRAAFLGELGLRCKYQLTERLSLKAGYEAMWLQGVALAPAQINNTLSHGTPITDVYVQALGIDSSSGVFFHGATAGLEYSF